MNNTLWQLSLGVLAAAARVPSQIPSHPALTDYSSIHKYFPIHFFPIGIFLLKPPDKRSMLLSVIDPFGFKHYILYYYS